jgi:hypothetical protein
MYDVLAASLGVLVIGVELASCFVNLCSPSVHAGPNVEL